MQTLCVYGCFVQTLERLVDVVSCYPVANLTHDSCYLQGREVTFLEHRYFLRLIELVLLELQDYEVLGIRHYLPSRVFTFLNYVFHDYCFTSSFRYPFTIILPATEHIIPVHVSQLVCAKPLIYIAANIIFNSTNVVVKTIFTVFL